MDITVNHITKSYQGKKVLENVSMKFLSNKITCIMGTSGVGKTTLLHILMGLIKPDEGSIEGLEGKTISAVFQEDRLCEAFDAITNVRMVIGNKKSTREICDEFRQVSLESYEGKQVSQLSGGMKRRVAIVRAVMMEADLYIMDEPFKGLDEELKRQVILYVKEKLKGKTVIIVTHEKSEVELLSAVLSTFHAPTFVL